MGDDLLTVCVGGTADGGSGYDTLVLAGGGDLSALTLTGVEALMTDLQPVTGTAAQFEAFSLIRAAIDSSGDVTLNLVGGGTLNLSSELESRGSWVTLMDESAVTFTGGGGRDVVAGRGGADRMTGQGGWDAFSGGGDDDHLSGGAGSDNLGGGEGADRLFGGDDDDILGGEAGDDRLSGDAGNDVLTGGAGADDLTGGAGADWFKFDTSPATDADRIRDFVSGEDRLAFSRSAFEGILTPDPQGYFVPGQFALGTQATEADDRLIYDQATGKLWLDADGSGAGAQVLLATLSGAPALTAADIFLA